MPANHVVLLLLCGSWKPNMGTATLSVQLQPDGRFIWINSTYSSCSLKWVRIPKYSCGQVEAGLSLLELPLYMTNFNSSK